MWVITSEVKIWYFLSRVGYDHPCVSFMFSCGYLGLFSLLVVCSCTYVRCFHCLGALSFQFIYVGGFWLFVLLVSWLFHSQ